MKFAKFSSQVHYSKYKQWNERAAKNQFRTYNKQKKEPEQMPEIQKNSLKIQEDIFVETQQQNDKTEKFTPVNNADEPVILPISINPSTYIAREYYTTDLDYEDMGFDIESVQKNSEDLYDVIESYDDYDNTDEKPIYNINSELPDSLDKNDRDNKIVTEYCKNPTTSNFTKIWKRFYPNIKKYATRIMGDETRADDMVQETFQKAWEKRSYYNPEKSRFTTWLQTLCRNVCLSTLKNDSRCNIIDMDLNDMCNAAIYTDILECKHNDSSYYVLDKTTMNIESLNFDQIVAQMYETTIKEMNNVNPLFSDIIHLKDIENMSLKDIAENLGVTVNTVRGVYYELRIKVREKIIKRHAELYNEYLSAMTDRIESTYIPSFFKPVKTSTIEDFNVTNDNSEQLQYG